MVIDIQIMLLFYGHVLKGKDFNQRNYTDNAVINFINLIRVFLMVPLPYARLILKWQNQHLVSPTESIEF